MASIAKPPRPATGTAKGIIQLGGSNVSTDSPQPLADGRIDEAATWLATAPQREMQRNVIVELRDRFKLTPGEACAAIRQANVVRGRAT